MAFPPGSRREASETAHMTPPISSGFGSYGPFAERAAKDRELDVLCSYAQA